MSPHTLPDLRSDTSSSHPNIDYRSLDWSDALDSTESPHRSVLHDEIKADVILGADLVSVFVPAHV